MAAFTLHPTAAGRFNTVYGGVYIGVAILWLWLVDSVKPSTTDLLGASICLVGEAVIVACARASEYNGSI